MIYDLRSMVNADRKRPRRKPILLPVRRPTLAHEEELFALLLPIVKAWEDRLPRLIDASGRPYMGDGARDVEREVNEASGASLLAAMGASAALYAWVQRLDLWHRRLWIRAILSRTGLNLDNMTPVLVDREAVRQAVAWATALIRDVSDQLRTQVATALTRGAMEGLAGEALAARVSEVFEKTRRRAALIARDQAQKIAAKLTEIRHADAGIAEYSWQHSFRRNPRRHHVERQGQIFRWDRPPSDGHPGHAPNCRCTAAALITI